MGDRYLRRYTDIPALIYLLSDMKITLLDPRSWDDSNDSYYLSLYREKKNLKSVLALCFTQIDETYHHWRVFADGSSGVCVKFNRSKLLEVITKQRDLRTGPVKYLKLAAIQKKVLEKEDLPFLKRYAFQPESEFRVIYESKDKKLSKLDIAIPLSCIEKITLSPWIHYDLFTRVKQMLRNIRNCRNLKIVRSTLIGNEQWKSLGEHAK